MLTRGSRAWAWIWTAVTLAVMPVAANANQNKGGLITEAPFLCENAGDGSFSQFVTALGRFQIFINILKPNDSAGAVIAGFQPFASNTGKLVVSTLGEKNSQNLAYSALVTLSSGDQVVVQPSSTTGTKIVQYTFDFSTYNFTSGTNITGLAFVVQSANQKEGSVFLSEIQFNTSVATAMKVKAEACPLSN